MQRRGGIASRYFFGICAVVLLLAQPAGVFAQDAFPSKPLHMVVPFPPGGLTDVLGRAVAERLGKALGQTVIVENKPGAGTLLGAEYVAKSAPDGYTLLLTTSTTFGIAPALYRNLSFDPIRDLKPVSLFGTVNFFLVGSPAFAPRTLAELISQIKANPGKYNYASVGNGSAHHLFMEDFKRRLGLEIQHVPYKGTPAALVDLIPGKIQIMFSDAAVAIPQIRSGKLIAYATSAAKQNLLIPSVPPIANTVPGFDWHAWQGVSVPAATPAAIVSRLYSEMQKFQNTAEFREFLAKAAMEPSAPITPAEFGDMVKREAPIWAEAVRKSGARID